MLSVLPPSLRGSVAAKTVVSSLLGAAAFAAVFATSGAARADTLVIKQPGNHARYSFEAEPHLILGFIDPPGVARGTGFGLGFRGTVPLVHNGFISSINNSVGIGFGADLVHYDRGHDHCVDFDGNRCVRWRDDDDGVNTVFLPVVMQWNFFLSRNWSVFGEPGVAIVYHSWDGDSDLDFDPFVFYAGGRYHFSDTVTLTMRIGYPTFSVGVSFLL